MQILPLLIILMETFPFLKNNFSRIFHKNLGKHLEIRLYMEFEEDCSKIPSLLKTVEKLKGAWNYERIFYFQLPL